MITKSSNPTLYDNVFYKETSSKHIENNMTLEGTVNKTFMMFVLLFIAAGFTWVFSLNASNASYLLPLTFGSAIGGFIIALVIIFKKSWAPALAPIYAIFEGLFLGTLSAVFNAMYPGIVVQAVFLTFAVALIILYLYKSKTLQATPLFKKVLLSAIGAIFIVYILSFFFSFFGWTFFNFIYSSGPVGIIFSLIVVGIAALSLVLDFDLIEKGVKRHLPKYMEWYGAFSLMVTLVWLYIEILHLLAKLRDR